MGKIIAYRHHDKLVLVDEDLQGRHRVHCLCYRCARFSPEDRPGNCVIAERVEELSREYGLALPVWECPSFAEGKPKSFIEPEFKLIEPKSIKVAEPPEED